MTAIVFWPVCDADFITWDDDQQVLSVRTKMEDVSDLYLRIVSLDDFDGTREIMDMLLAKKRAGDRKQWLEAKGDLATLEV